MGTAGETAMQQRFMGMSTTGWAGSAFEAVFFEHYGRIVGVLSRIVGDRAHAEELASDAFLRLYEQPRAVAEFQNVGGWLYRTATRLGLDFLRARRRRTRYEQIAGAERESVAAGPLDDMLRAETARTVRAALARMKPAQAQILTLRSSGLSYKEIAESLGTKVNCVGRLLARAETAFENVYGRMEKEA